MLATQTSTPIVSPTVAGALTIPVGALKQKLGKPGFYVWQVLIRHRDPDGITHITRAGIGNAKGSAPMSKSTVMKGLARLREVGLIHDEGWCDMVVRQGDGWADHRVWVRRVFGARSTNIGHLRMASIPADVYGHLARAVTHGGRRAGAGRPRKHANSEPRKSRGVDLNMRFQVNGAQFRAVRIGADSHLRCAGLVSNPAFFFKRGRTRKSRGVSELIRKGYLGSSSPYGRLTPPSGCAGGGIEDSSGGDAPSPEPRAVPPYPSVDNLPVVNVPPPPLLDAELGPVRMTKALLTAYRAAVRSRYGRKARITRSAYKVKPADADKLLDAAAALIEHEIAPAAWVAFSCDVWRSYGSESQGKNPPPLNYVFNMKRIIEQRGWMRSSGHGSPRTFKITASAREIHRRDADMRRELLRVPLADESTAGEIVERHFPGDLLEQLRKLAQEEVERAHWYLDRARERGDWLPGW